MKQSSNKMILLLAGLLLVSFSSTAAEAPKKTAYEKLIGKDSLGVKGFLTIHMNKGKTYFVIPDSLYGRDLVMGATVKSISDNGVGLVGSKNDLHLLRLYREGKKVLVKETSVEYVSDNGSLFRAAPGAILHSLDIKATAPDSSAVVDATELFLAEEERLSPFVGYSSYQSYNLDKQYRKEYSYIVGAKAFSDNISVTASRSYVFTATDGSGKKILDKEPFTAIMCYSFLLLPSHSTYEPRRADPRIGYFHTTRKTMGSVGTSSQELDLVNRWRIEPSDSLAWLRGEKVLPKKQIVFYIDPNFPDWWRPYIHRAVNDWSIPFERLGYKNAVVAKDFPTPEEDPEFDPDNIKYSCIRYQPVGIQNAMGPSWTDPRTGEILNASVYVYHDVIRLVAQWMFIQTSQNDESIRTMDLPREKLGDALEYVIRHEVGHCLGLMHNMGSSSAIPVDSLRSPSFTAKNGTTYSIMDYARFNYVARPGDRVKLTPPRFGKYDYWAIRWGYAPGMDSQTITDSLQAAPWYRYGLQQFGGTFSDPRNQVEDLGDDVVAASRYGIQNLQVVFNGFMQWLEEGDPLYEYRTSIYRGIINQYKRYAGHIIENIGGLMRNDIVPGDSFKRFQNVPRAKQEACLNEILNMLESLDWIEDRSTLEGLPIAGSPALALRKDIYTTLLDAPFRCAYTDGVDTKELDYAACMEPIYAFTWKKPGRGGLTKEQRMYQTVFVTEIMRKGGLKLPEGSDQVLDSISGYEWTPRAIFNRGEISQADVYATLYRTAQTLKSRMKGASAKDKAHYSLLLSFIQNGTSIK